MASSAAPAARVSVESAIAAAKRRFMRPRQARAPRAARRAARAHDRPPGRTRGSCVATITALRARQGLQQVDDPLGRGCVEVRRRLVEQQQRRPADERAGECDAALFAGREPVHLRIEPNGEAGRRERSGDLGVGGVRVAEPHCLGDRPGLEQRPLRHPGELPPPGAGVDRREIDAGDGRPAGVRIERSGGAARAGSTCRRRSARRSRPARPGCSSRSTPSSTRPRSG